MVCTVEPALAIAAHGDQPRVSQERQVLRHARVAQLDPMRDLADRQFVAPDGPEDLLAARLGDDLQGVHRDHISRD